MNKIGIHTFVWNDGQSQKALETALELTHQVGFDLLELPGLNREVKTDRIAKRAEGLGLQLAASCGLPPDHDITSSDATKRKRGEALILEQVMLARDVGATQLSGPINSGHQKFQSLPTKAGWNRSVAVLSRIAEKAKAANVAICFEVLNRYETNLINTVDQGLAFIKATGSHNLFLHIDTYHMNIEEADMFSAIKRAGSKIGYFHMGESHRGKLGTGHINFPRVFDALLATGYDKTITVEAFNNAGMSKHLRSVLASWRDVWIDPMDFAAHAKTFVEQHIRKARQRAAEAGDQDADS